MRAAADTLLRVQSTVMTRGDTVPVSRAERRAARGPRAEAVFGPQAAAALDILELTELAWHDCYGDVTPPDEIVDDIYVCAGSDLGAFASLARLAVADFRDLRTAADAARAEGSPP